MTNTCRNFRITPLRNSGDKVDMVESALLMAMKYPGAKKISIGERPAVKFLQTTANNEQLIYWYTGEKEMAFICSFTPADDFASDTELTEHLELIEQIITSIKILDDNA